MKKVGKFYGLLHQCFIYHNFRSRDRANPYELSVRAFDFQYDVSAPRQRVSLSNRLKLVLNHP